MSNLSALLQNYNNRHYYEYRGYVRVEIGDGCSGYLTYDNEVIPGTGFEDYDQLTDLLLNG